MDLLAYIVITAKTLTVHTSCGVGNTRFPVWWNHCSSHRLGGDGSLVLGVQFLHKILAKLYKNADESLKVKSMQAS